MKRTLRNVVITALFAVALTGVSLRANATVIDLGERHLDDRFHNIQQAIDYIEMDQNLGFDLTYLNAFDKDGFENNGAVDSSHFDAMFIDGSVHANISWDLGTTGFQLSYVLLKDGSNAAHNGDFLYHLYGVTPDEVFNSMGDQFVTVDDNGIRKITYIAFFGVPGSPTVPDGGATLALLGLSLGGIELVRRTLRRRTA
jgi:VPDSG-CTERM motif